MKSQDVHNLADDQLVDQVANARTELFNLRFQHSTGQLEDTAGLKRAKRTLARSLTIATERGIDVEAELRRQRSDG